MYLVGFIIRYVYHEARSSECQIQRMSKYILILFCLLRLCIFMSPHQILHAYVISLVHSARYDRLTPIDLNILISGEEQRSRGFSLCRFSSLCIRSVRPKILTLVHWCQKSLCLFEIICLIKIVQGLLIVPIF